MRQIRKIKSGQYKDYWLLAWTNRMYTGLESEPSSHLEAWVLRPNSQLPFAVNLERGVDYDYINVFEKGEQESPLNKEDALALEVGKALLAAARIADEGEKLLSKTKKEIDAKANAASEVAARALVKLKKFAKETT